MTPIQIAYLTGALAVLVLLAAIVILRRRDRSSAEEAEPVDAEEPEGEEGEEGAEDASPGSKGRARAPSADSAGGLELALEPRKLSIGLVNATLSCELRLANLGKAPMVALRIASDMLSAHASRPNEEHLRGPDMDRALLQKVPRLDPGESVSLPAELVLPVGQVQPMAQGESFAMLPLVRVRVVGAGTPPVIRTALIGRPPNEEGGRLKLFPLDADPKIHTEIAARMLE